ncbi:hypothetical protein [Streptomyces mangrovisoli]|uniref:NADH:ubiquinone oxidoreductase intermediate-associated protein 30 domain-containing protein n=1 Tax=Streptomyces mangrovisoli TaxID=1428628 RepID=A0A1J4P4K9_9ACTN|nr:hypothetical protein [Streptomyces mangrovisoli]OIJ68405.1 hypothetical protein WN71_008275 [Streptomyces mangrovisoli]
MPQTFTDHRRSSSARRAAVGALGVAAFALAALSAPTPAYAESASPPAPTESGGPTAASTAQGPADFGDCPSLPAGVDPAKWRCEVHTAAPEVTLGNVTMTLAPITMTHAEGPLPDGSAGQVWGAMHSTPTPVPGGLDGTRASGRGERAGHRPEKLFITAEYGGSSDFYTGRLSLRFKLTNPLLSRRCAIGGETPVDFQLKRSGPSEWISQDPPIIKFSAYDDTFTAPGVSHCGPLTGLLDRRLGLPASDGNLLSYDATYTFVTYDKLPGSQTLSRS